MLEPFAEKINMSTGRVSSSEHRVVMLSELRDLVADRRSLDAILSIADKKVYEVFTIAPSTGPEHLIFHSTILYPGTIGKEFFFTKGHFHKNQAAEFYIALRGRGIVLLHNGTKALPILFSQGDIVYIPPEWAHRTINIGNTPLIFISVHRADAGYEYERAKEIGFKRRVLRAKGENGYIILEEK